MKKIVITIFILLSLIVIFIMINTWISDRNEKMYGDYYSENEFLRTIDCASIFDSNPFGTRYKVSFDLKTKVAGKMIVYQQNGHDCRYSWNPYPIIETSQEYTHFEIILEPFLVDENVKNAYLSFYGEYGSGVVPTIKNIKIEILE